MKRREFIRMMGGVAAAAAVLPALPWSIRRALSVHAHNKTGTINDVEHVVILMQENRSFDHYFGTLRGVRGFADRFPIPLANGNPVWHQSNGNREVLPFRFNKDSMNAALIPSMPHGFPDAQAAWNQGSFGYWPKYKTDTSMGYYTREEAPFQYALADAFTICDAYHCSLHAATDPNRIVFWSGSNHDPVLRDRGINCDDTASEPVNIRCAVMGQWPNPGYTHAGNAFTWKTIPDLLEDAGVSWRIYQDPNDNWSGLMHGGLAFSSFRDAKPGSANYVNGMSHYSIDDLQRDVTSDTLPSVSWILPTPLESEHPGAPSSAARGGYFVEQILQALTSNPKVWGKTVFFLAFDENDGLFDHMPPPAVPSYYPNGTLAGKSTADLGGAYFAVNKDRYLDPSDKASGNLRPWGMGPRVPMYVISPWTRGGWVNSQVFDHTSVGMFLEKRFGIAITAISKWHRAVSGDLTSVFDFENPNNQAFPQLPEADRYDVVEAASKSLPKATAPDVPQPLYQESGVRYSRGLPYSLHVNATMQKNRPITLEFVNLGTQGAVFHVYDKRHLDQIPRRYTVEASRRLEDNHWDPYLVDRGEYDLEIHGPNGFFRALKGSVDNIGMTSVNVRLSYDIIKSAICLSARNKGAEKVTLSVRSNAYRSDGPWQLQINGNQDAELQWQIGEHGNWYDFSIMTDGAQQRFAGRMETGSSSISDPAQGTQLI